MEQSVKKQKLLLVALVAALVFVALPALAQTAFTADEQALIDYVQGAFDNFLTLDSFTSTSTNNIVQHIDMAMQDMELGIDQTIAQTVSGQAQRESSGELSMSAQVDQTILQETPGQPTQNLSQTIDMVVAEGDFFMRFSNVTPATMASFFPSGWVNLSENRTAFAGAEMINPDQFTSMFSAQFQYPLDEVTVERIKELPAESMNGVNTRVVRLVFNGPALFNSGEMDQYLSAFNTGQLGVDMDQLRQSMGQSAALEMTAWIGVDDNLVYRVDTVMSLAGDMGAVIAGIDSMYMEQQATISATYADFNEPVTIEPPV
jgi:hypothetical protein